MPVTYRDYHTRKVLTKAEAMAKCKCATEEELDALVAGNTITRITLW